MMKRLLLVCTVIAMVAVLVVIGLASNARDALADTTYSEKDMNGVFAFSAQGTIYPAFPDPSLALAAAGVGLFTFDGAGGCTVVDQLNIASLGLEPATGFRTSTSCDYAVNADGTGTLMSSFGGNPGDINGPSSIIFVIADKGPATEFRFIRGDPGAVAEGVAKMR
jgi:hypothetical protein